MDPGLALMAKIHLKMPQNRRSATGFPDLGFLGKCPRFTCLKFSMYKGLLIKKKSWSYGTTLGCLGGPISRGYMQTFFATHSMLKIYPNSIYLAVMATGYYILHITTKLESCSSGQNIARPDCGRRKLILCKIVRNTIKVKSI